MYGPALHLLYDDCTVIQEEGLVDHKIKFISVLNTAHSGTVYGVLWPADMPWGDVEAHAREMAACMPQLDYLMSAQMISGGILYE